MTKRDMPAWVNILDQLVYSFGLGIFVGAAVIDLTSGGLRIVIDNQYWHGLLDIRDSLENVAFLIGWRWLWSKVTK